MSTIASPRPSIALSSRRNSNSTDTTSTSTVTRPTASNTDTAPRPTRRNRAALRDYYGLKAAAETSREPSASPSLDAAEESTSELDQPGFDAQSYVQQLLGHADLESVLRVAAGLGTEIRALDGERKALVYDNYSKLIAATDTIRRMRERMDPLTPTTSTLTPAIEQIAATAAELAATLRAHGGRKEGGMMEEVEKRRRQRETVRWVLAAPERIRGLVGDGEVEAAQNDWREVSVLLDQWHGVKGAEEVQHACLEALDGVEDG